jgi:Arc/MetJ-type ribon-helix-helix transcriptional regulator
MERTQISLEERQARRLRQLARRRGVSMAHLIREAVERVYGSTDQAADDARWERAMGAIGSGHGGGDAVARDHDRYLEELYRS